MSKQILHLGASSSHTVDEADDEVVILSNVDNSNLISRLQLSLVGRMFHKEGRSIEALVALLPKENIWDVEGRVRGVVLGNSRFQFDFDSEADLQKVLRRRPCHFNKWSFSLERWEPHIGNDFPNFMTFWIRTEGIPRHFWVDELLTEFGGTFGVVRNVDASSGRIQLTVRADEPLKFKRKAQIPSGECVMVYLFYEKLHRWCSICSRICHEKDSCPLLPDNQSRDLGIATHSGSVQAGPSRENLNRRGSSPPSWWRDSPTRYEAKGRRSELEAPKATKDKQMERPFSKAKGQQLSRVGKEVTRRSLGKTNGKAPAFREPSRNIAGNILNPPSQPRRSNRVDSGHKVNVNNIPRIRETSHEGNGSHRKRSFEEAASSDHQYRDPSRGRASKTRLSPVDSQLTISEPLQATAKVKQGYVSLALTRERPFRLTLSKKSDPLALSKGKEKEGELGDAGDSSDLGSVAKKSLNFDVLVSAPAKLKSQIQNPRLPQSPLDTILQSKSWYEQTVEEEEAEAANLQAQASEAATIRNSISRTSPADYQVEPFVLTSFELEGLEPSLESNLNGLQIDDGTETGMEWDRPLGEEDGVDLELGEEDEFAYRDSDYLMEEGEEGFETGEYLVDDIHEGLDFEDDDLLGEEYNEENSEPVAEESEILPGIEGSEIPAVSIAELDVIPRVFASNGPKIGEKKKKAQNGKKGEQKNKGPAGPSGINGAVSKKLSKASPLKRASNPRPGASRPRSTRKAATNPRSEVFPSSKSKVPSSSVGKAGLSDPSDTKV